MPQSLKVILLFLFNNLPFLCPKYWLFFQIFKRSLSFLRNFLQNTTQQEKGKCPYKSLLLPHETI